MKTFYFSALLFVLLSINSVWSMESKEDIPTLSATATSAFISQPHLNLKNWMRETTFGDPSSSTVDRPIVMNYDKVQKETGDGKYEVISFILNQENATGPCEKLKIKAKHLIDENGTQIRFSCKIPKKENEDRLFEGTKFSYTIPLPENKKFPQMKDALPLLKRKNYVPEAICEELMQINKGILNRFTRS